MNKKVMIILIIVVVGAIYIYKNYGFSEGMNNQMPILDNTNTDEAIVTPSDTTTQDIIQTSNVKEFVVTGKGFSFSPNTIMVKKGDTLKITFKNVEGFHDFRIDQFSVATKQINAGMEETIQFMVDKTGSFEYYCSVGKHRAMGMKGTLTVTE